MSLPRPVSRSALVAAMAFGLVAAGGGVASAHVSVSSSDAAPGGFGKMTFRVPNESDTASTVSLRIQIPEEAAMASLRVQPVPGWTVTTLTTATTEEPLQAHGEEITSYISLVEFRAVDGGGIAPGEFQEFSLSGGTFPEAESLAFPAVQGYSDGSETAWIEPTVEGQEEPEHPAPVLTLAAAPTTAAKATTAATEATTAATDDHEHASATDEPGALALLVAFLALLTAIGGVVLGVRANRRTVSS